MAYSTDDIKALAAILKPIIKSALESGSTGVGDLEVVTSLDSVYSLPALRMPGGIHDVVEAPLSLLRVNLRMTTTHVQWKLGNGEWKDLLALSELRVVPKNRDPSPMEGWRRVMGGYRRAGEPQGGERRPGGRFPVRGLHP